MTAREPASLPTLKTGRLTLRPFALSDAPEVQRLAGEREVASTTLEIPHPYEDGMAEEWIRHHASRWEAGIGLTLAVTTEDAGLVGAAGLKLDLPNRRAELGYWVGVPFWNRGYATEASEALLRYGFTELGLNRVDAHFLARNPASGRVLEKLGMRQEGVLRQHIVKWGVAEDVVLFGVLRDDYRVD